MSWAPSPPTADSLLLDEAIHFVWMYRRQKPLGEIQAAFGLKETEARRILQLIYRVSSGLEYNEFWDQAIRKDRELHSCDTCEDQIRRFHAEGMSNTRIARVLCLPRSEVDEWIRDNVEDVPVKGEWIPDPPKIARVPEIGKTYRITRVGKTKAIYDDLPEIVATCVSRIECRPWGRVMWLFRPRRMGGHVALTNVDFINHFEIEPVASHG
jgi:hypothetical protein